MHPLISLPDKEFVEFCDRCFLGRGVDPEGLSGCLAALESGAPRMKTIRGSTSSEEYFRLVHRREQREKTPSEGQDWIKYRIEPTYPRLDVGTNMFFRGPIQAPEIA